MASKIKIWKKEVECTKEICNEVERKRMDNDEEVEEDMCIINLRIFIF